MLACNASAGKRACETAHPVMHVLHLYHVGTQGHLYVHLRGL